MTLLSPEKMRDALDLIAKGIIRPSEVSKGIGVSYRTYRYWLVRSNRGDPEFLIDVDGTQMQFAAAVVQARRLAMLELRGMLEQYSIFGREEIVHKDGQVVWQIDPVAAALPEEARELMGYRRDALVEIDGALQPVTQHHLAPIALQLRLLEATFKDMRPSSVQEVNVNGNVAVGIGFAQRTDFSGPPPAIPDEPPIPQLEVLGDVEPVGEIEELLGPEPVLVEREPDEPQPSPPVERVIRDVPSEREKIAPPTPKAIGVDEVPARAPRNDLERDLFAKLAAVRSRGLSNA